MAMANEDGEKIAAASSAAAERIQNLLSASDVETLKHHQLLMYVRIILLLKPWGFPGNVL
jgi:hypothetical protein